MTGSGEGSIIVRAERPSDVAAIRQIHAAAFPTPGESRLVDALRDAGQLSVSLVAEVEGTLVGHVAFSPVRVQGVTSDRPGLGLAPVAVLPAWQRRGVGRRLIAEGLQICKDAGHPFAVVLGEPEYYRRFGFVRAGTLGLDNEYGADDAFMAIELEPGGLPAGGGLVQYAPEFARLGE